MAKLEQEFMTNDFKDQSAKGKQALPDEPDPTFQ